MRHLASVKKISSIVPIEGRDHIVLAAVDGWSVIVRKDQFVEGDLCVYCEVDSVMPETETFEFLRSKNFRIKTMKMAGVISQGICFPLSILPHGSYNEGDDVTDILGIKQYEATMDTGCQKEVKATRMKWPSWLMRFAWFRSIVYKMNRREGKGFPSFIKKTDEIRIQNIPNIVEDKSPWVVTEKIDGQSGTFALVKRFGWFGPRFEYIVCSRNMRLFKEDDSSFWSVSRRYSVRDCLRKMIGKNEWVAIQGECIAPKVQKNKYRVSEPDLYVFNVLTPKGRMPSVEAMEFCSQFGLKFVPILRTDYVLPDSVAEVIEYAHGESLIGDTMREGLVFRSQDGVRSFKAVDPLFLLKYDE